jgi:3-phenylpropionate/trans-cinnamate dioxygenase ferredoxin reductase subunit
MRETFVIVGASLAGAGAVAKLREEGFDGRIVLIGQEQHPPYERPPLSKEYLRGEDPFEKALVHPLDFYSSNDIETRFGTRATRVDTSEKTVLLQDADPIRYDKVLIATGCRNRRFPIPGLDLDGVYDLRTKDDSDRIRAQMVPGRRAAVVGMGFIGSEVAASLRDGGLEVVGIHADRFPLSRVLGDQIGKVMREIHRDHGVDVVVGERATGFEGTGRVERIVTESGRKIECDFAVVGLGVEPVTDILVGSNVEVDNGIVVDERCRTNVEGVFAAGDVTNHFHPILNQRMRLEHWHNALNQGPVAARNMMGLTSVHDEIPWFWSDQYDYNLQYVGFAMHYDDLVVRGSLEDRDFIAFYLNHGLVSAAVGMNRGIDVHRAAELIRSRTSIEPDLLADHDLELNKILVPLGS